MDAGDLRAVQPPARVGRRRDRLHAAVVERAGADRRRQALGRLSCPPRSSSTVTETEPGVKGDTVSNVTKPAKLETGAIVQVPLFVNTGDRIKVDPRRGPLHLARVGRRPRPAARAWLRPVRHYSYAPCPRSSTHRSACSARSRSRGGMPTAELLELAEILDGAGLRLPRGLRRRRLRQRRPARRREPVGAHPRARGAHADAARARAPRPLPRRLAPGRRRLRAPLRRLARPRAASTSSASTTRSTTSRTCARRARRSSAAEREFDAGLVYSPGRPARPTRSSSRRGGCPSSARRACCSTTRPARSSRTARTSSSARSREASGLPVGLYCQGAARQRARRRARGRARRRRPRSPAPSSRSRSPLHRVSGEALAQSLRGLGLDTGVDVDALWRAVATSSTSTSATSRSPRSRRASPSAPRSTACPPGLVAGARRAPARARGRRPARRGARRARARSAHEAGWPPLAAPIGQVLASQALLHVLSAEPLRDGRRRAPRARRGPLRHAAGADRRRRSQRAVALTADDEPDEDAAPTSTSSARRPTGSPRARRSCSCSRSSARRPSRCCTTIRGRAHAARTTLVGGGVDQARAERIRELVRIVQESGVAEITIEEGGMRVSVRRTDGPRRSWSRPPAPLALAEPRAPPAAEPAAAERLRPRRVADGRHLLPRARARGAAVRRGGRRRRRRARRSASSRR